MMVKKRLNKHFKKLQKKLHKKPNKKLERFALLFFSIAVVFAALSFIPPWKNAYAQTASALGSFDLIYITSVYELGDQSTAVANSELNPASAWDAWETYIGSVLYPPQY